MAKGEGQGVQIALIIFVILTIILSVTTFIFFRQYEDAVAKADGAETRRIEEEKAKTSAMNDLEETKRLVGLEHNAAFATQASGEAIERVRTAFNEDKAAYMATFPEAKQNYRGALAALQESLDTVHAAQEEDRKLLEDLGKRFTEIEKQKADTHAQELARAAEAGDELNKRTAEFAKKDKEHVDEKKDLADKLSASEEKIAEVEQKAEQDTAKLQTEIAKKEQLAKSQGTKLKQLQETTFEVADGEIRWVNQTAGTVWINLGSGDALPKQLKFSVWGRDENDVARSESKGKIEVTQILDEHLAEATILEDFVSDPIMRGDKIFTPLWQAGRQERFALAGRMDIDNDGEDDRKLIRNLIAMNGGAIDAELEGSKITDGKGGKGAMTINTRYLIVGDAPPGKDQVDKWSDMRDEAIELGVEIITVAKFLDHVGYTPEGKAVQFGRYSDPDDFKGVTTDGNRRSAAGATSGAFKKRSPRTKGGSAY